MSIRAFRILGIEPTTNPRVIRAAFVRLSQIYHPDRFLGSPDALREEAEQRMQELTAAYNELRVAARTRAADPPEPFGDPDVAARRWREAILEREREDSKRLERWHRWERLEEQARARMRWESEIAASLSGVKPVRPASESESEHSGDRRPSLFEIRLEEARGLRNGALVRLEAADPPMHQRARRTSTKTTAATKAKRVTKKVRA
jgi:curved DNA-binding protein CbpA